MDSERWGRLDKLLHDALALSPEERDGFLRQTCGRDAQLEREAGSLLSLEPQAVGFLENPPIHLAAAFGSSREGQDAYQISATAQSSPITAFSESSAAAAWASSIEPRISSWVDPSR